jgi:ATP-binding cassette subfamily E protein 1
MTVSQMLDSKLELDNKQQLCDDLELNKVLEREVSQLSGGELQRFAIAMSCIQRADVYVPFFVFPCYFNHHPADTCSTSLQVT